MIVAMGSSSRALLVAKSGHHMFDDRVLTLEVPAKIGRSHKDDQADSDNAFFDCKVLSKQHALLMVEEEKFFLMDTGSSNGTFVNNVRLSRSGDESKMTRIYTGDVLRFGSDVVDKVRRRHCCCHQHYHHQQPRLCRLLHLLGPPGDSEVRGVQGGPVPPRRVRS